MGRLAAVEGKSLESWFVAAPGLWENDKGPLDWYAVGSVSGGIIAYFEYEHDAELFRAFKMHEELTTIH